MFLNLRINCLLFFQFFILNQTILTICMLMLFTILYLIFIKINVSYILKWWTHNKLDHYIEKTWHKHIMVQTRLRNMLVVWFSVSWSARAWKKRKVSAHNQRAHVLCLVERLLDGNTNNLFVTFLKSFFNMMYFEYFTNTL